MIRKWQREYPVVSHVEWAGFENLGASTLGITRYDLDMTPSISLHSALENHPIWAMSVLWHEFAHAAAYYESGTPQAHGDKWKGWLWKKPILALINCFCPEPKLLRGSKFLIDRTHDREHHIGRFEAHRARVIPFFQLFYAPFG